MTNVSRRQQIEEMLASDPEDPFLRYALAMEFVSVGDDAGAVERFSQLLASTPDYIPAYQQAGQAMVRLGRVEEAAGFFRNGIAAARARGDQHAAEEMQGFLEALA